MLVSRLLYGLMYQMLIQPSKSLTLQWLLPANLYNTDIMWAMYNLWNSIHFEQRDV